MRLTISELWASVKLPPRFVCSVIHSLLTSNQVVLELPQSLMSKHALFTPRSSWAGGSQESAQAASAANPTAPECADSKPGCRLLRNAGTRQRARLSHQRSC